MNDCTFVITLSYEAIASSVELILIPHRTTGDKTTDLGEAIALTRDFVIAYGSSGADRISGGEVQLKRSPQLVKEYTR
jgi:hypothetical protein